MGKLSFFGGDPNKQIYRELMKKTFPTRRKAFVEGMGTVKEILDAYPAPDEVSRCTCKL